MAVIKSTKAEKKEEGFLVTVGGQFFATYRDADGHTQKKIKNYRIQVKLATMDAALSTIKNFLLEPALKKKYPEYTRYRTHVIKHVEPLSGSKRISDFRYMNLSQLNDFVEDNGFEIDCSLFTDVQELRDAINRYNDNPEAYAIWEEQIGDVKRKKIELAELNPDILNEDEEDDGEDEAESLDSLLTNEPNAIKPNAIKPNGVKSKNGKANTNTGKNTVSDF